MIVGTRWYKSIPHLLIIKCRMSEIIGELLENDFFLVLSKATLPSHRSGGGDVGELYAAGRAQ